MKRINTLLVVAIFGFWASSARADDATRPLDNNFLVKAASCENAEIEIAKLADKHSSSEKVKEFAAQIIKDHQKSYDKLAEVIKTHKIGVVAGFEKDTKAEMDRLSKLNGAAFDREFIDWAIKTHKDGIVIFEAQANDGKDADSRSFAANALPTLREHLKRAEKLSKSINQ